MLLTKQIIITGKVQGVFFRQSAKTIARNLGITGTVQNMSDSTVMIFATGTTGQLNELIDWCHQGPPRADVLSVESTNIPLRDFSKFSVL